MFDLLNIVFNPPASNLLYEGFYDPVLLAGSLLVAVFSAYASFLVSQHAASISDSLSRRIWIVMGGLSLGFGIWSMHFIGMLAFSLPCSTSYDATLTLLSIIPGILASTLAVHAISRKTLSFGQLATAGLLIGTGVGTMHYSGMAAMQITGLIRYNAWLFLLSIVIAVVLATLALWLKFRLQSSLGRGSFLVTPLSAGILGLAIAGMHYTAMFAAYFVRDDSVIVDAGMDPNILALIVLIVSGLIIVITIIATFIQLPSLLFFRRFYRMIGAFTLGWLAVSWIAASTYYSNLAKDFYKKESTIAVQQVSNVASNIEKNLKQLMGIPLVIVNDPRTLEILKGFGHNVLSSQLSTAERQARWTQDRVLSKTNRSLALVATNLGADALMIINAAGDCIAASNSEQSDSFVGTNFFNKKYFYQASKGERGHKYTVEKIGSNAGLYYSDPVFDGKNFVGAVVVKRNVSQLSEWTVENDAFVTNTNGLIIIGGEKEWENRRLPDTELMRMRTESTPQSSWSVLYEALEISKWKKDSRDPAVVLIGSNKIPRILLSKSLQDHSLSVHVAHPMDALTRFDSERVWLFFLLASAGSMLIIAVSIVVLHLRETQKMEGELRVAATAFNSDQGMLITDANEVILRVNKAFTKITGYSELEAVGQTPRLLQSGRHDSAFFAAMWDSIKRTGAWEGEIWGRRKSGEIHPEWMLITAVKDTSDQVTHYVSAFADITAKKKDQDEINSLAFYDPLTNLPNRRLLIERLKHAYAASERSAQYGALLFIDLDNFKDLNDSRGHHIGDFLLQQVALRLTACIREGDTTARLGGDEFVVLIENMSKNTQEALDQARTVGEKIHAMLNLPYQLGGYAHRSTPSIGIALFSNNQGSVEDLIKQADLAMYQAKSAGRNTLCFFDPQMQAEVTARAAMKEDMREGILKNQFLLHYQAQVTNTGRVTGVEVLLRWQHPVRGMVSPAEFIELAEISGLILPLGHWVMQTACTQLAVWAHKPEMSNLTVAVNVSAHQFRQPDFVAQVLAVLEQTGANPRRLKLELTESLLINDVEDIISKMTLLKAHGISFSLDDFGTGYSSLSYLKRLPLDQLKIDQGFVRNILTDSNDAAIAKMVIALSESLGLKVIAEGVELEAQKEFLLNLGCYAYQGYLFSRPLSLDKFEEFLGTMKDA